MDNKNNSQAQKTNSSSYTDQLWDEYNKKKSTSSSSEIGKYQNKYEYSSTINNEVKLTLCFIDPHSNHRNISNTTTTKSVVGENHRENFECIVKQSKEVKNQHLNKQLEMAMIDLNRSVSRLKEADATFQAVIVESIPLSINDLNFCVPSSQEKSQLLQKPSDPFEDDHYSVNDKKRKSNQDESVKRPSFLTWITQTETLDSDNDPYKSAKDFLFKMRELDENCITDLSSEHDNTSEIKKQKAELLLFEPKFKIIDLTKYGQRICPGCGNVMINCHDVLYGAFCLYEVIQYTNMEVENCNFQMKAKKNFIDCYNKSLRFHNFRDGSSNSWEQTPLDSWLFPKRCMINNSYKYALYWICKRKQEYRAYYGFDPNTP